MSDSEVEQVEVGEVEQVQVAEQPEAIQHSDEAVADVEQAQATEPQSSPTGEEKKRQSLFDEWPLTEDQTQMGLVAVFTMVLLLVAIFILRPSGTRTTHEPDDPINELNNRNVSMVDPTPIAPPPPPVVVDFNNGQLRMIRGAPTVSSGFSMEKVTTFIKSYGIIATPLIYFIFQNAGSIFAFLGGVNIGVAIVAILIIVLIYNVWPSGPEGEGISDYAKFLMSRLMMVLGVLMAAGLMLSIVYSKVPPEVWAQGTTFINAYIPVVKDFFLVMYQRGLSIVPHF